MHRTIEYKLGQNKSFKREFFWNSIMVSVSCEPCDREEKRRLRSSISLLIATLAI